MFLNSLLMNKSSKNWKIRRDAIVKYMGLSRASSYIPTMIDSTLDLIDKWKDGEKYTLISEFNKITFRIITIILFGKDVNEKIGEIEYIEADGSINKLDFAGYFIKLCKTLIQNSFSFRSLAFPFFLDRDFTKPYSTDKKNILNLHTHLKKYLKESDDEESVYYKLINIEDIKEQEAYEDVVSFLFAGHETSSHSISSALYFMAKFPKTQEKLRSELLEFRGKSASELKSALTKNKIGELDYLYMVFKESLRYDPPANESLPYVCIKDCEILGVPIYTGQEMSLNLLTRHMDPEEWKDPLKFIPERFDENSEFYYVPKREKKRHTTSYIPFNRGIRNCPGQVLATLEIKVLLVCFLSQVEYQVDQELLDNDYVNFNLISTFVGEFVPKKLSP